MLTVDWIDKTNAQVVKLTLNGRAIYRAHVDGKLVDPSDLRGHVMLNISPDLIAIAHWVIFESIDDGICQIAPLYDDLVDVVMKDTSMFEQPVDIRSVYDMLSL